MDDLSISVTTTMLLIIMREADSERHLYFNWTFLCFQMKEAALDAVNPHLFTVATLTGHAYLAMGEGYSIGKSQSFVS